LYAAIRDYHKYKSLDLSWFPALLKSIPLVSETESLDRKVARMLPYSDIKQIPGKISLARKELAGREPKELAALVRDELLMTWLLLLPWRQRNLRECRIGGPNPNLFKAPLPKSSLVARPVWVRDIEAANPNACFWQFRFSEKETKMGNRVHAVLPRQLCGLLEGYLREHRNHLLSGSDPQTLFVNYKGRAFTRPLMTSRVSTLAMRFAGGKMSPHVFRDAFAHEWLTTHPDDYLTVSKLLWHRNIQTTLKIYGAQFNESSAVCRLDEWLEASAART
jgi:integrase